MHTMNTKGSDVRALPSAGEFWDMSPEWSPTGNKIAFVVHSEISLPTLYTANADGTNRQSSTVAEPDSAPNTEINLSGRLTQQRLSFTSGNTSAMTAKYM